MFIPVEVCWFIAGALSMLVGLLLAAGISAWHQRSKEEGDSVDALEKAAWANMVSKAERSEED